MPLSLRIFALIRFAATIIFGLVAFPFVGLVLLFVNRSLLKKLISFDSGVSLLDPDNGERLHFVNVPTTPSLVTRDRCIRDVTHLAETQNWRGLSELLREWDQDRTTCDAGYSLAEVGTDAVLEYLAERNGGYGECNPEGTLIFRDETAEQFETLAAMHRDSYPLLALAVRIRIGQAWGARGNAYAGAVSQEAWAKVEKQIERARWLLEETDPIALNSPLLSEARYRLLAFLPDAPRLEQRFYEEWSDLDPISLTPHSEHARMMLGRWFGDGRSIEVEAQKATLRTAAHTGDAAYFIIYYNVIDHDDIDLSDLDTAQFAKGAHDFMALRTSDPSVVARFATAIGWWGESNAKQHFLGTRPDQRQRIIDAMKPLRANLLRRHLTALHAPSWEDGYEGAFHELSEAFQDELANGANLFVGDDGVTVSYPDQDMTGAIPAE